MGIRRRCPHGQGQGKRGQQQAAERVSGQQYPVFPWSLLTVFPLGPQRCWHTVWCGSGLSLRIIPVSRFDTFLSAISKTESSEKKKKKNPRPRISLLSSTTVSIEQPSLVALDIPTFLKLVTNLTWYAPIPHLPCLQMPRGFWKPRAQVGPEVNLGKSGGWTGQ